MATLLRIVIGALLIAHGLVHLLYLTLDVPEFSVERSWLVSESAGRPVDMAVMWATVGAFALLGLAVWGVPVLAGIWPGIAIVASALSLALLVSFWGRSLVLGVPGRRVVDRGGGDPPRVDGRDRRVIGCFLVALRHPWSSTLQLVAPACYLAGHVPVGWQRTKAPTSRVQGRVMVGGYHEDCE